LRITGIKPDYQSNSYDRGIEKHKVKLKFRKLYNCQYNYYYHLFTTLAVGYLIKYQITRGKCQEKHFGDAMCVMICTMARQDQKYAPHAWSKIHISKPIKVKRK